MMGLGLGAARAAFASSDEEVRRGALERLSFDGVDAAEQLLGFLVEAMGDGSWRVRKEAAARASAFPDRARAATLLAAALSEPENVGRRNAVVEALAGLGPDAVPAIESALAACPDHRKLLVETLGLIGHARATDSLVGCLDDADPNVRVTAAEALGRINNVKSQAALAAALGRGELLLSLAALDSLNRQGAAVPKAALEPLYAQPALRAAAVEALGRSADLGVLDQLTGALADPARSVREAATTALAELHRRLDAPGRRHVEARLALKDQALQPLVAALLEGTLGVQRAAARVLGLSGRAEAARPLALALGDSDLRPAALEALATLGPAAVETLVTLAPNLEGELRADLYGLLPELAPPAADERVERLLADALSDEDLEAGAAAAHALGALGGAAAIAPLCAALEREEPVGTAAAGALSRLGARHYDAVRALVQARGLRGPAAPHLCRILGVCGRPEDVPLVRSALGDDAAAVRRAAAESLGLLPGSVELDEALLFALADESAEVRAAAARSLGSHGQPAAIDALGRAALDGEPPVRAAAASALGAIMRESSGLDRARALAILRRLADSNDAVSAVPALENLGALADAADDMRFIAALESTDAETVKAAARALGRRSEPNRGASAREALQRALVDRRWDVRQAAAQALGEHGPAAHALLYARRTVERDGLVLEAIDAALARAVRGPRPA